MQSADPRTHGLGHLAHLPDELVERVCRLLGVADLLVLSQCSKALARYCLDEPLWAYKASDLAGGILHHQVGEAATTVEKIANSAAQTVEEGCHRAAGGQPFEH